MVHKLGVWLRPALLGPWLAISTGVTVAVFFLGQWDPLLGGRFANWVVAMIVGSLWSGLVSALLLGVDVARASIGTAMPQGPRAWIGALVAVAIAWGLFTVFPPGAYDWGLAWIWAVLWPNAAGALIARVATWRKNG